MYVCGYPLSFPSHPMHINNICICSYRNIAVLEENRCLSKQHIYIYIYIYIYTYIHSDAHIHQDSVRLNTLEIT